MWGLERLQLASGNKILDVFAASLMELFGESEREEERMR